MSIALKHSSVDTIGECSELTTKPRASKKGGSLCGIVIFIECGHFCYVMCD